MKLTYHPPADRGVTTLMYVGDDDAVDKATSTPSTNEKLVGALAALIAWQSRGVTRLAAASIASYVGYRMYSRK